MAVPEGFFDTVQSRTYQAIRNEPQPVPGIRQANEAIALSRCVASSSERDKIALSLTQTRLLPLFSAKDCPAQ